MPVIKRYPNRKLYDTEAKQYITLEGIAELIRRGEEVHVVDNATGEDLTALTLTQIILEQEKKKSGFLPRSVLANLIRAGGDRFNALQRTMASSFGLWHQIDEEIKRRIDALVNQGDLSEKEGQNLLEKLISLSFRPREELSPELEKPNISVEELEQYLAEHQVPTREDLERLLEQLEALAAKIEDINQPG